MIGCAKVFYTSQKIFLLLVFSSQHTGGVYVFDHNSSDLLDDLRHRRNYDACKQNIPHCLRQAQNMYILIKYAAMNCSLLPIF